MVKIAGMADPAAYCMIARCSSVSTSSLTPRERMALSDHGWLGKTTVPVEKVSKIAPSFFHHFNGLREHCVRREYLQTTDNCWKVELDLYSNIYDRNSHLDLEKSYAAILKAAREQRFISYGDLAAASNVPWSRARYLMPNHLGQLVTAAYEHGWPMPSAIVVNKDDIETGRLEASARDGFLQQPGKRAMKLRMLTSL